MIIGVFTGDKVYSNSSEAFGFYEKSRWGEKIRNRIEYSFVEALFLASEKKMEIISENGKKIDFESLMKKMKKIDKKVENKFVVFSDLRKKGFLIKTALKFGADFRIYEKGIKPGEEHARWIAYVIKENEQLEWKDFTAKNRIAHSTKKQLLLAIVDEEGDVSYYQSDWLGL